MSPISHRPQRYRLNAKQLQLLKLLYKFRYGTAQQLARYKGVGSPVGVNRALQLLLDQNYVHRIYDRSYRLQGKGARYYLAATGLRRLRGEPAVLDSQLHAMYKDKRASQRFIDHQLTVFSIYLHIRDSYPGVFDLYSRSELSTYAYFPRPRPDIYIPRTVTGTGKPAAYFLDLVSFMPRFAIATRITAVLRHYDAGIWESETGTNYPVWLLVCADTEQEAKVRSQVTEALEAAGIDDLPVYTATQIALSAPENALKSIWHAIAENAAREL